MRPLAMERERLKYLFREVLGVDVDAVVSNVLASIAVERAEQVRRNSRDWEEYMAEDGGIIFLPDNVVRVGRKAPK
jgi:hypothetical protein